MEAALAAGAAIEGKDPHHGQTALMRAAMFGQAATTKALLEAGARTDARAVDERTALHWAVLGGSPPVVGLLIGAGAPVDAVAFGESPLGLAVDRGSLPMVNALLAAGARTETLKPNLADHLNSVLGNRRTGEPFEIARALIRTKRGLDQPDAQGRSPLFVAAAWGHREGAGGLVRELLTAGAPASARDAEGRTAAQVVRAALAREREAAYAAALRETLQALEGGAPP